jgi:hypothetical protein
MTQPDGVCNACKGIGCKFCDARFLSQREWVGLTDEELSKTIGDVIGFNSCVGWEEEFARAIEAKLKEKNNG